MTSPAPDVAGALPVVAVVGRPNVGKSSLVNRIVGRREAIVEARPGVTRDRRAVEAEWRGRRFEIVDTGGLEQGQQGGLEADVATQARVAIAAADVVVLVVDAGVGPMEDDDVLAASLRRAGKPVLVAANKVDTARDEPGVSAFFGLGLGEAIAVSALHGRGSGDLLDAVLEHLPEAAIEPPAAWAGLAIVGRPNVGKSSLLNALVGERRALVAEAPGTTRDPVDSLLRLPDGRTLRLVDTAGMRREVRVEDPIEYFSLLRSRRTLARADAALLVVDASEGATSHDQRIGQEIAGSGRACVIALNKWDVAPDDEPERARLERAIDERLRFLRWATRVRTSAVSGRGVARILPAVDEAIASHRRRVQTAWLNGVVREAQARRPHGRAGGRAPRALYAVQTAIAPPTIVLFTNGRLEPAYLRYLERAVRAAEPFRGSPLRLEVRPRKPRATRS